MKLCKPPIKGVAGVNVHVVPPGGTTAIAVNTVVPSYTLTFWPLVSGALMVPLRVGVVSSVVPLLGMVPGLVDVSDAAAVMVAPGMVAAETVTVVVLWATTLFEASLKVAVTVFVPGVVKVALTLSLTPLITALATLATSVPKSHTTLTAD